MCVLISMNCIFFSDSLTVSIGICNTGLISNLFSVYKSTKEGGIANPKEPKQSQLFFVCALAVLID